MEVNMDGIRIKELREANNMSQWAFSKATGIERSRISLIENGYVELTDEQIATVNAVFNVTEAVQE